VLCKTLLIGTARHCTLLGDKRQLLCLQLCSLLSRHAVQSIEQAVLLLRLGSCCVLPLELAAATKQAGSEHLTPSHPAHACCRCRCRHRPLWAAPEQTPLRPPPPSPPPDCSPAKVRSSRVRETDCGCMVRRCSLLCMLQLPDAFNL
jgi:hypothetical protein